jgi:Predicted phosphohydrolases
VLVGGDITDAGSQVDVDEFISARASLGVPVYSVPGNHDLYDGGWKRTNAIGPSSFTLELSPNVRLVCLDSANGTLGTEQAAWLSGVLSDAKEPTIILATHMNFFTAGYAELLQFSSPEEVAMILSMCRSAGVDLSLAGHTHSFDEETVGGMKTCVGDAFLDGNAASTYLFVTYSAGKLSVERRWY